MKNYDHKILDNQKVLKLFHCLPLWKMKISIDIGIDNKEALALFGQAVMQVIVWHCTASGGTYYPAKKRGRGQSSSRLLWYNCQVADPSNLACTTLAQKFNKTYCCIVAQSRLTLVKTQFFVP